MRALQWMKQQLQDISILIIDGGITTVRIRASDKILAHLPYSCLIGIVFKGVQRLQNVDTPGHDQVDSRQSGQAADRGELKPNQ